MNGEFHEDYSSPHLDPMDGEAYDFDWPGLYAAFGETEENEGPLDGDDLEKLSYAIRRLLSWIVGEGVNAKNAEARIARRVLALSWVLDPGYLQGKSLTEVANRLGLHKQSLAVLTAEFSRQFIIRNRAQSHAWNFRKGGANA